MRSTKFALSAGAAVAVVAALNIPLAPSSDLIAANQAGAALNCNLTEYKASTGLTSALEGNVLTVAWNGQGTSQLRARFAIDGGTPTIRDLSVRRGSGEWAMLGQNLTPEYQVTTGRRRMSNDQANAFASLGIDVTPELLEKYKWYAFWDAPLSVPGYSPAREGGGGRGGGRGAQGPTQALGQGGTIPEQVAALQSGSRGRPGYNPNPNPPGFTGGRGIPLPRTKEEIRRGVSAFSASSCEVKSDGASLAVTFPGMKLGIFDGNLRFTVYRGTNLIQMDAIARTNEPSVAYKYDAGLKGFSTATMPRVTWRDTGGHPQQHQFGGPKAIGLSGDTRVQPSAAGRRSAWLGGHVPAAAHVLLHARGRRESRVRLLSQRRRRHVQHRRHDAGSRIRYVPAVRAELRVVQRPSGHVAEDVDVLLREPGARRSDAAGGARVHTRRRLQAGPRLQDVRQSLPSAGRRPDARGRVRHAASGPDGDEGDRPERDRLERFPRR